MKTQKEIEKGCRKDLDEGNSNLGLHCYCNTYELCSTCQALLQQNKEFIEMIDKLEFKLLNEPKFNAKPFAFFGKLGYIFNISSDEFRELKSSIIGEEKKQ